MKLVTLITYLFPFVPNDQKKLNPLQKVILEIESKIGSNYSENKTKNILKQTIMPKIIDKKIFLLWLTLEKEIKDLKQKKEYLVFCQSKCYIEHLYLYLYPYSKINSYLFVKSWRQKQIEQTEQILQEKIYTQKLLENNRLYFKFVYNLIKHDKKSLQNIK